MKFPKVPGDTPQEQFTNLVRHVVSIPKGEIEERKRPKKRRKKTALKVIGILGLILALSGSASARSNCKWIIGGHEITDEMAAKGDTDAIEICPGDPPGYERRPWSCAITYELPRSHDPYDHCSDNPRNPFHAGKCTASYAVESCRDAGHKQCSCGDFITGWGPPQPKVIKLGHI